MYAFVSCYIDGDMSSIIRKIGALILSVLALTTAVGLCSTIKAQSVNVESIVSTADSAFTQYQLNFIVQNSSQLRGTGVATSGIAKFYASVFMFEDFWLQSQENQSLRIPVVARSAGIPKPSSGDLVKILGTIEYSNLEGGFFYLNASSIEKLKNVILIGWDGTQRNHLFELLNRSMLPNLQALIDQGAIVNTTVSDHRTDTKSGWTQILTGYRWFRTGIYSNWIWFHAIPAGYTIPERFQAQFGKDNVKTAFIAGKEEEMEVEDGSASAANGTYTHEALYGNLPESLDFVNVGERQANAVGSLALQFLQNNSENHFFAFFHFSDPDEAGHNQNGGGENSVLYENAIVRCDNWLGRIRSELDALNLTQDTLIYVTADHGFDEGGYTHYKSFYSFLATNDGRVIRNGDEVDVAPTVYFGLGMWGTNFQPILDGYPMQISLPDGVEQHRQDILDNYMSMIKPNFVSPKNGSNVSGVVNISFNVSDIYLNDVVLLVNNTLVADGPWTWSRSSLIEANCSYNWDTSNLPFGAYEIRVFLFDEHGSTNGPEQGAITVNVVTPPQPTTSPSPSATPTQTPFETPSLTSSAYPATPSPPTPTLDSNIRNPQPSTTPQQTQEPTASPYVSMPSATAKPSETATVQPRSEDGFGLVWLPQYLCAAVVVSSVLAGSAAYLWLRRKK